MAINALFIVEGAQRERRLVNALASKMLECNGINVCAYSVCGNIHMLYDQIMEMGGFANTREVLLSLRGVSEADKALLSGDLRFAYTYLVFDLDLQHYDVSVQDLVRRGLRDVEDMLEYFCDETDDTVGKLYINYPMIESYRDHNDDLQDYLLRSVTLQDCVRYKRIVGERGDNKNYSKYDMNDFMKLAEFNLRKAGHIVGGNEMPDYEYYINSLGQMAMFHTEEKSILEENRIDVLNTFMMLPIDYEGKEYFRKAAQICEN